MWGFAKVSEKASRFTISDLAPCKNRKLPIRRVIRFLVFVFMIYDQIPDVTFLRNVLLKEQAEKENIDNFTLCSGVASKHARLCAGLLWRSFRCAVPWLNIDYLMLCTKLIQFVAGCQC